MTVNFNGKNDNDFRNKVIFISDIKEMLTTIWFLNVTKILVQETDVRDGCGATLMGEMWYFPIFS